MKRRHFLKLAGAAPFGAALASLSAASALQATQATSLSMWWWGEAEAAGIGHWIDDTIAAFREETGVDIQTTELTTAEVVDRFTAAAANGSPPDIQFFWNGIYHMENVWRGYVEPLNNLVAGSVLRRSGATRLSTFEGKQYRAGSYAEGFGLAYNRVLFDRAGLDADNPPRTWDELLNACDRLKAAEIVPFGGGVRDGYFGDWYLVNTLSQSLNSPVDAISLFVGDLDWREPRYHEHWARLQELRELAFFNDDITTLEHFPALARFDAGQCAMCLYVSPSLLRAQERLGRGNVGFMVMPIFGKGRMAGFPILDTQGFGIPAGSRRKHTAARFIEFMHTKERLQAMWELSGAIPADEAFDARVIDDPFIRQVYDTWLAGPHVIYIGDLMPVHFWTDVMFVASQRILAGEIGSEEAGDLAYRVTEDWRAANPDVVSNYARWARALGL